MSEKLCNRCGTMVEPDVSILDKGPHYASLRCPKCRFFIGFLAKPKNEAKLEKRPHGTPTPEDLGISYCQICLRQKAMLGKGYLETHHIDDDPTNDDRLNYLVVCVACHKLINWTRTYIHDHFTR